MADQEKVRVAIIGIGNCASALVQGVEFYKDAAEDEEIPGLMHATVGGYHVSDIEFTAAFDVVKSKVGKDLSEAIWAKPNNTIKFITFCILDIKSEYGTIYMFTTLCFNYFNNIFRNILYG